MVNYNYGKIYKIINENNDTIYIGSTAQYYLSNRYSTHHLKNNNNKIILIEKYSCNSKDELLMREQEVIEEHTNLVNKNRAFISIEQLKEYQKINTKKWREDNKEEIRDNKKLYNKNHKEEIKIYNKNTYNKNKETFNEKRKEKITCDICGSIIRKDTMVRHKKTKKCINFN
tara:strand:+ start:70 stop:585 length:516 start_codon:yes stop_codon:yes gene_type:complete